MKKIVVSLVALGVLALSPAPAQASTCPAEPPSSQAFLDYGDTGNYFLAPGGDFESATTWTLARGAAVSSDGVNSVLALPPGASALSPSICVSQGYTHGRMFAAAVGHTLKARVEAEVIYNGDQGEDADRLKIRSDSLTPTARLLLDESAFGLDPVTGNASVRLMFTSKGPSTALIDRVYIDPSARN